MNKSILLAVGIISFLAAIVMFLVGSNSSHLTELKDFFWVPIPLGILGLIGAFRK